jgi:hypothetical protein
MFEPIIMKKKGLKVAPMILSNLCYGLLGQEASGTSFYDCFKIHKIKSITMINNYMEIMTELLKELLMHQIRRSRGSSSR